MIIICSGLLTLPTAYMAIHYNIDNLPGFNKAVITIGTFDGVHLGHKAIIDEVVNHAKAVGGESVLLTFEPHPRKVLFPEQTIKILTPLNQKLHLISDCGIEHVVVVPFTPSFAAMPAREYITDFLVKLFKPESIVIGYDHHFGHDRTGNINLLIEYSKEYGYKVFEISEQLINDAAVSSTKIRNAVTRGLVQDAAVMIGRPYSLTGTVVHGAQLGRNIGYPTANIEPADKDQIIPGNGVYAVKVKINGIEHSGMLNIGIRPTVSNETKLHIEANIFDFDNDIYGKEIEILFITRLRDESKFESLDALKEQLGKDKLAAMNVLQS